MSSAASKESLEGALRAMLADEVARVLGSAPVLPEQDGWRALSGDDRVLHRVEWAPESWRWFELVELSVVAEMVVLVFRWLDPETPNLAYVSIAHIDGLASADGAAVVARQQFRRLLAAGWRDEVERTWLSTSTVLIRRRVEQSHPELRIQLHELIWNEPRGS